MNYPESVQDVQGEISEAHGAHDEIEMLGREMANRISVYRSVSLSSLACLRYIVIHGWKSHETSRGTNCALVSVVPTAGLRDLAEDRNDKWRRKLLID